MRNASEKITELQENLLSKWSAGSKFLLAIFSVFLVLILGYCFYLQPRLIKKKLLQSQIVALKMQLTEKQKLFSTYSPYKEQLAFLKQKFFLYPDSTHKQSNREILLALISGQMLPDTLTRRYLTLLPRNKQTAFTAFPVETVLEGNKKNIIEFLYQIANLPYPILLKQFKCSFTHLANTSDEYGRLSLLFHLYQEDDTVFLSNFTSQAPNNVFNDKKLQTNHDDPLTHYSLKQLEMRGFLGSDANEKCLGLIQSPDKKIYNVKRGDTIGLEQARIIHINKKKIVLRKKDGRAMFELIIKK